MSGSVYPDIPLVSLDLRRAFFDSFKMVAVFLFESPNFPPDVSVVDIGVMIDKC